MLTRDELLGYVGEFNAYQVEKDYLQHITLSRLYQNLSSELVFKGGTALQKAYNLGRFSEDLDFTMSLPSGDYDTGIAELEKRIDTALDGLNGFYESSYDKEEVEIAVRYRLKVKGPMYSNPRSIQTIRLEISKREKILMAPSGVPVSPRYKDIGAYIVLVMDMEEMLSEKMRAILTRRKARDLYDIYFLLSKNVGFNFEMADRKLEYYKIGFGKDEFKARALDLKKIWLQELQPLMKQVPDFGYVYEYVTSRL